jgi:hypothetical protein
MIRPMTLRTERLVLDLLGCAKGIDDRVLAGASEEARHEWRAFLGRLPTAADLLRGVVGSAEDELERTLEKVIRFRAILSDARSQL